MHPLYLMYFSFGTRPKLFPLEIIHPLYQEVKQTGELSDILNIKSMNDFIAFELNSGNTPLLLESVLEEIVKKKRFILVLLVY